MKLSNLLPVALRRPRPGLFAAHIALSTLNRLPAIAFVRVGLVAIALAAAGHLSTVFAQDTAFTYQGRLNDGANPANGSYDLRFILFNVDQFGFPVGNILTNQDVALSGGLFTVSLDFGAAPFAGTNYWLEIGVRPGAGAGAFTTLMPRQPLTPAPYALYARLAGGVTNGSITAAALAPGAVGSGALANGAVTAAKLGTNGAAGGQVLTFNGSDVVWKSQNFWQLGGNSGVTGPGNILGTLDNVPVELRVNNQRALRIEPTTNAPNLLGGYVGNRISPGVVGGVIAGGGGAEGGTFNLVHSHYGAIGGGSFNLVGNTNLTVAEAMYTTIAGGLQNRVIGPLSAVGGGYLNSAFSLGNTIGAGQANVTSNNYATVVGGIGNRAVALRATVGGGANNRAQGQGATVPGGENNDALGNYSFAAGRQAKANHAGSLVWADSTAADFASTANNQFLIRANGGVGVGTPIPLGVLHLVGPVGAPPAGTVPANNGLALGLHSTSGYKWLQSYGGVLAINPLGNNVGIGKTNPATALDVNGTVTATTFNPPSDRQLKENFERINPRDVLEKVAGLDITRWNFKGDTATPHLGPVAQDFHAAFGLGADDKHIATVDADGVALAAIQGLNEKLEVRSERAEVRTRELEQRLEQKETEITELKQRLEALEKLITNPNSKGN